MENTNKKWSIAISPFGNKYSMVISSWEIDSETGNRINSWNRNLIEDTMEAILLRVNQITNEE